MAEDDQFVSSALEDEMTERRVGQQQIAEALVRVATATENNTRSIDALVEILPTLRSEVDERVELALAESREISARNEVTTSRMRRYAVVTGAGAVVIVVGLIVLFFGQRDLNEKADVIKENGIIQSDCLRPEGVCFKSNRETLKVAIKQINDGQSAATDRAILQTHADFLRQSKLFCRSLETAGVPQPPECVTIMTTPDIEVPAGTTTTTQGGR